jgi:hypothetical protein
MLADLRKRLDGPSVARHRKRIEAEFNPLVESDGAMQFASRPYLRPKGLEALENALVARESANRVFALAAKMRKRSAKKSRSRRVAGARKYGREGI